MPGEKAIHAAREHRIVIGVSMTNRGCDRGGECAVIQTPPRQGSSHPSAIPGGRVRRDCRCLSWRAARKEFSNFHCDLSNQFLVLFLSSQGAGRPRFRAFLSVLRTFLLRFFQRGLLDKNALPFIAPARSAEAHYDSSAFAIPGGSPRQRSIAGRKKLQISQARTRQAQRLFRLHYKEAASREFGATFRTRRVPHNFEDYRLRWIAQLFPEPLLFAFGQGGGNM
jgi:hypothetical protein